MALSAAVKKPALLFAAASLLLFAFLGAKPLWTQEHRWAAIVSGMFFRQDFLHPWLNGQPYYDKPLLSYWLMAGLASLTGKLSAFVLRLPSAMAGLLAVVSVYTLGTVLRCRTLGLLAGWMLLTTFYFVFWARTSSADMLNLAGILCAVSWYFANKHRPGFFVFLVFFVIMALTGLCKGLVGPAVILLAVLPDLLTGHTLKTCLRPSLFLALLPGLLLYFLPFWASSHHGGADYAQNGLAMVWRENVVRYFHAFDHKGPVWTYLEFLPVYLMPWTLFFIPALWTLPKRWHTLSAQAKQPCWIMGLLFVFLTVSGSRRNYYILPVVPFALLMTADWILSAPVTALRKRLAFSLGTVTFLGLLLYFTVLQPLYASYRGPAAFIHQLRKTAEKIHPWQEWHIVLLDAESRLRFYLALPPDTRLHGIQGDQRSLQTPATLQKAWPFLAQHPARPTLYVSRAAFGKPLLQLLGPDWEAFPPGQMMNKNDPMHPIAFLPAQHTVK